MLYKKQILEQLTPTRFYEHQPNGKDGKYLRCRLDTRSHPFYTEMRNRFYSTGRKIVTTELLNSLNPIGLALWYQDDGWLSNHKNFDQPGLCTHGFTKEENQLISRFILERFGLNWGIKKDNRNYLGKKLEYYCLTLARKDREKFFWIISPFIAEGMEYKITPRISTKATRLNEKLLYKCQFCGIEFPKDFKHRAEPNRFCSHKCYGESKRALIGTQVVALVNGRFKNEHGQFIKNPYK